MTMKKNCKNCAHCTPDDDGFCWCDIQTSGEMTRLMTNCCDEWDPVAKEEAEAMARKIKAVLNGAEVIEMLDMDEIIDETHFREVTKMLIDKACKWLNEQLYTDDGGCLVSDRYQKINEFLAAFLKNYEADIHSNH